MPRPVRVEELSTRLVYAFVLMSTKIIPLRLEEVGGQSRVPVPVEIVQCRGERRNPDSIGHRGRDNASPCSLRRFDLLLEEGIEQEVCESRIFIESLLDLPE